MEALPTVAEELERKTLDAIADILHKSTTGRLPKRDAAIAAHAIWSVTAGLVSTETMALVEQVANEVRTGARQERHFIKGSKTLSLYWTSGEKVLEAVTRDGGKFILIKEDKFADEDERTAHMAKVSRGVALLGFTPL